MKSTRNEAHSTFSSATCYEVQILSSVTRP